MAATESRPVVDFLNHGLLPFVGREAELRTLLEFPEGAFAADSLRVFLILGEAGSGKSRLLHEARPLLERRGMTIQAKIYPETSGAVSPLIAGELRLSEQALPLLRDPVEPTRAGVTGALRRIAGLRPTILIVEDVHLLADEALADFAALLDSLADEPLSLICTARPTDQGVRDVLERFLASVMTLDRLEEGALGQLWRELFGEGGEEAVRTLAGTTLGNPLAVRSALRNAVGSEALVYRDGVWRIGVDPEIFARELERSVRRLSAGMTVHLSREERNAAERLAGLGEVFAREGAEIMVENCEEMIHLLLYKGIITRSITNASPLLSLPHSSFPLLAFTHTLVHQELVESARPDIDRLARVIVERRPIYTILPFQLLGRFAERLRDDPVVPRLVRECFAMLLSFYHDPVAYRALYMIRNAISAMASHRGDSSGDTLPAELTTMELLSRITVDLRSDISRLQTEEYSTLIESVVEQSRALRKERPDLHLLSLSHWMDMWWVRGRLVIRDVFEEIRTMVQERPDIRFGDYYIAMLNKLLIHWRDPDNDEIIRYVKEELEVMENAPQATANERDSAFIGLVPPLLPLYRTPEEYQDRCRLFQEIEERCIRNRELGLRLMQESHLFVLRFTYSAGLFDRTLEFCPIVEQTHVMVGDLLIRIVVNAYRLRAQSAFDPDIAGIRKELAVHVRQLPDFNQVHNRASTASLIGVIGLLRGDHRFITDLLEEIPEHVSVNDLPTQVRIALALDGLIEDDLHSMIPSPDLPPLLSRLLAVLLSDAEPGWAEINELRKMAGLPLVRTEEFASFHVFLSLLQSGIGPAEGVRRELHDEVRGVIRNGVAWLEERRLFGFMEALLEKGKIWLTQKEIKEGGSGVQRMREEFRKKLESPTGNRTRISVFGTVTVLPLGAEPKRIAGSRTLMLLGLLILNRMTRHRLSYEEIVWRVAGRDVDYETAVKGLQVSIFRLREAIGRDGVTTARRSPELNTDLLDVDLLDGLKLIEESERLLREGGNIARARRNLEQALGLAAQGVLFPALYDELFETAREEFENRLRQLLLATARRLNALGDLEGLESLSQKVRPALGHMQDLDDLLVQALEREGKRLQALRVRESARMEDDSR